jgi:hypothetical protein
MSDVHALFTQLDTAGGDAAARDDELRLRGDLLAQSLFPAQRSRELLESWVSAMRTGQRPFDRGRSQIHNNGFAKISLAKLTGGWHLRLHAWPAAAGDARVHDHRWSFVSAVLAGRLEATNYEALGSTDSSSTPCYRLFDAVGDGEKRLEQSDPKSIRPIAHYQLSAGGVHFLRYDQPHIVRNPFARAAVTLMLSAPAEREFSHSYGVRSEQRVLPAPPVVDDARAITYVESVLQTLKDVSVDEQ